jgi:hypothetical protein
MELLIREMQIKMKMMCIIHFLSFVETREIKQKNTKVLKVKERLLGREKWKGKRGGRKRDKKE